MKRSAFVVPVCAVLVAAPAAAQWTGMPVWNDPKGGTGITVSGEYGRPQRAHPQGNRYIRTGDATAGVAASQTKVGYALGANLTFGMLGVHLAYDYQKLDVGSTGGFGVGAHLDIRAPGGF